MEKKDRIVDELSKINDTLKEIKIALKPNKESDYYKALIWVGIGIFLIWSLMLMIKNFAIN